MEYAVIIVLSGLFLILLWFLFEINIKKIKQLAENKELNDLTNSFPENMEICKTILAKLGNTQVKIKEEKETKTSLYIVVNNTITIANIRDSFTRIQTIAHECIHSVQSKKILWFNFIYTNIYLLYFIVISVLSIFGMIKFPMMFLSILLLMGMIHYTIRSMLETDAMTKARYVAKEYMEENNLCHKKELENIMEQYDLLNNIGIKLVSYDILAKNIIKGIVYAIICIIIYS